MRRFLILGLAWTALVLAVLLFWPSCVRSEGCWRLVDASADCLAQLAEANDRLWWTQTLPMLAFFASGYIVVGLIAVRRWRRSRG
jgi:hypothetical protein